MTNVEARKKVGGKTYEISVDFDEAMKVKKGDGDVMAALNSQGIYHDVKKGDVVSQGDLQDAFKTTDLYEIAEKIIKEGEIQKPQEFRDSEREKKVKQVVDMVLKNAVDQNGRPYTEDRIMRAIDDAHYSFDDRPAEKQMADLVHKLKEIIPIKIEVKRIKLVIPAQYTGQVYGILQDHKEREEWRNNGDLEVVIAIPAGMQMDFFDKLNNMTHGAVQSEEVRDE